MSLLLIPMFILIAAVAAPSQDRDLASFYAIFLSPVTNPGISENEAMIMENEHLRIIGRLAESGSLANGGPFEGGGEILLLRTSNKEETEAIFQNDPAIVNGLLQVEILNFNLRFGTICEPDFPYEMKTYSFVRYTPTNQIASYKTNADFDMRRLHESHIRMLIDRDYVLMEGIFSGGDGGMIIFKSSRLPEEVKEDPAILEGYLKAEEHTIWLNKGSFCEK